MRNRKTQKFPVDGYITYMVKLQDTNTLSKICVVTLRLSSNPWIFYVI
jgi:hypothetical protein